ncbi:hypothetical protein AN958_09505 [Leucoagaricus sp. SymC.cos]|nr:hypothetical protein AN958_09505 [Leucoagaricus sp. SymC.cos]
MIFVFYYILQRSLVMDYLYHHCYTRTAVAFAKDSMVRHLDADGDEILQPKDKGILADQDVLELSKETLMEAELRNRIRVKILFGEVDDAIDLLNEHFPSVLAPPTPSSKPSSYPSALEAMNSSKHLIPTTTDPRHLILNLRIQPSHSWIHRTLQNTTLEDDGDQDKDLDRTPPHTATAATNGSDDDPHVSKLIQQGQKLYALLEQIHNPAERELYAQELVNVGALLAYPQPENSPLARYLSMERREAVAEQINKAILVQTGQSPTSKIENMTRYTTVLWALANEMKIKARPGMVLPPVNPTQRTPTPPMPTKQVPEGDQRQVVPSFNLQTFLDLR